MCRASEICTKCFEQREHSTETCEWDASQVTDMGYTFAEAKKFNGDVSTWDTSQVTSMYQMF